MNYVFYGDTHTFEYPSFDEFCSPDTRYPEYPFNIVSESPNKVYETIRKGFHLLGFDIENYGRSCWNPLGKYIKPGQTVLVKPNWVMHENLEPQEHDLDCLVTNVAVLRVAIDYVHIALRGTGKIIVADAPIQLCNFPALQQNAKYDGLWRFYADQNIDLYIEDLRGMVASLQEDRTFRVMRDSMDGIVVRLDEQSVFAQRPAKLNKRMRITNYHPRTLKTYHSKHVHKYVINPLVLSADVIIIFPNPNRTEKQG